MSALGEAGDRAASTSAEILEKMTPAMSFWIENAGCFRERSQRGACTAEFLLDILQFAGLLDAAQRRDDRVEQVEQQEHAILIVMQGAIAGTVSRATIIVQAIQQWRKLVEEFQARDVGFFDLLFLFGSHARDYAR